MVTDATIPASTTPSANSAAPACPISGRSACANSAAWNPSAVMWCANSGAVARIVATAAVAASAPPSMVSTRPSWMSRRVSPLSTVVLCWKKSIHGVTVAPMSATMTISVSWFNPPGSGRQETSARPTDDQSGCASSATGNEDEIERRDGEQACVPTSSSGAS